MNQLFRDRLLANIDRALVEAENCAQVGHPGMIGNVRQVLVESLLKPLLPEVLHIGTGKITDSNGNLSTIEVKSTLTTEEFQSAITKGQKR